MHNVHSKNCIGQSTQITPSTEHINIKDKYENKYY